MAIVSDSCAVVDVDVVRVTDRPIHKKSRSFLAFADHFNPKGCHGVVIINTFSLTPHREVRSHSRCGVSEKVINLPDITDYGCSKWYTLRWWALV